MDLKEIIEAIIVLVSGTWLVGLQFILNTHNTTSAIIFKVIPFFLGLGCLYVGGLMIGVFP